MRATSRSHVAMRAGSARRSRAQFAIGAASAVTILLAAMTRADALVRLAQAGSANAQCTILSNANFGRVMPYFHDPAPLVGAPCQVGSEAGYVSATSGTSPAGIDAVCKITAASGASIGVPYHGTPAPQLGTLCAVGLFRGIIARTSATPPAIK